MHATGPVECSLARDVMVNNGAVEVERFANITELSCHGQWSGLILRSSSLQKLYVYIYVCVYTVP